MRRVPHRGTFSPLQFSTQNSRKWKWKIISLRYKFPKLLRCKLRDRRLLSSHLAIYLIQVHFVVYVVVVEFLVRFGGIWIWIQLPLLASQSM